MGPKFRLPSPSAAGSSLVFQPRRREASKPWVHDGGRTPCDFRAILPQHRTPHEATAPVAQRFLRKTWRASIDQGVVLPTAGALQRAFRQDASADPARVDATAAPADAVGDVRCARQGPWPGNFMRWEAKPPKPEAFQASARCSGGGFAMPTCTGSRIDFGKLGGRGDRRGFLGR